MRAALAAVHARWGAVHGVVHAAGVSEGKALEELSREDVAEHFRSKGEGLYVLEEVLAEEKELDWCVVFSSLSAVLGGLGFGAYAAANSFMNEFVKRHNERGGRQWSCVAWDTWRVGEAGREGRLGGAWRRTRWRRGRR